jgi:hypothetical protein
VGHHLHRYQTQFGDAHSAPRIYAVLDGEPFPGKSNLLNRFFKRADRATTYLPVMNPISMAARETPWN